MKYLGRVICQFIGFENNNWQRILEVQWPVTKVNVCVSDVNNVM